MVRTFLKVYMELGSYFLFLQEQIKDIIIIISVPQWGAETSLAGQWLPTAGGDGTWSERTGGRDMVGEDGLRADADVW
jgi:hypothetical protein